jgi:hypothetical protein
MYFRDKLINFHFIEKFRRQKAPDVSNIVSINQLLFQGHKKCREVWPTDPFHYEKIFNIFLDILLLVLPLMILAAAYTMISRTLWQSMDAEKELVRQTSGTWAVFY